MGLLDSLLGAVLRSGMKGAQGQLEGKLNQSLGNTSMGDLGGLLNQLQQSGLGDQVSSWLGQGANKPVNPGQISNALGGDVLGQLAQQFGISPDKMTGMLAQALPGLVDKLSPNGQLPDALRGRSMNAAGGSDPLGSILGGLLGGGGSAGGLDLGGLLKSFQGAGMEDEVKSWLGNGPNKPIDAEQVTRAIPDDHLSRMADSLGIGKGAIAGMLAKSLPGLIDKLSPNGQLTQAAAPAPAHDLGPLGGLLGDGDLGSLLKQFQNSGMEEKVSSWLGNGSNQPLSPAEVQQAIPDDHLNQLGASLGLGKGDIAGMLAKSLPGLIDRLSPNGSLQPRGRG